jgi:hypothetical protein
MWIFVNALIENPTFDSQTKENMTLQAKSFGSTCQLSEKFIKAVSTEKKMKIEIPYFIFHYLSLLCRNNDYSHAALFQVLPICFFVVFPPTLGCVCVCVLFVFVFLTGSHYVVQAGLKLTI